MEPQEAIEPQMHADSRRWLLSGLGTSGSPTFPDQTKAICVNLRASAALLLLVVPLLAAVDGTVVNKTTGQPQSGATVTLYKLGQAGMESVESVKSGAQGKFHIDQTPQGPHL